VKWYGRAWAVPPASRDQGPNEMRPRKVSIFGAETRRSSSLGCLLAAAEGRAAPPELAGSHLPNRGEAPRNFRSLLPYHERINHFSLLSHTDTHREAKPWTPRPRRNQGPVSLRWWCPLWAAPDTPTSRGGSQGSTRRLRASSLTTSPTRSSALFFLFGR
jgi:hypothetical protein